MKKIMLLLVSVTMVTLSSCSSDGDSNTNPDTFIKFKVDGVAYNYDPETLTSLKKLITGRVGEGATYREVSLWMPAEPTVGAHAIVDDPTSGPTTYTAIYASDFDNSYDATSGTVTITSIDDNYIRGTFSYTVDTGGTPIVISEGEFVADN